MKEAGQITLLNGFTFLIGMSNRQQEMSVVVAVVLINFQKRQIVKAKVRPVKVRAIEGD